MKITYREIVAQNQLEQMQAGLWDIIKEQILKTQWDILLITYLWMMSRQYNITLEIHN